MKVFFKSYKETDWKEIECDSFTFHVDFFYCWKDHDVIFACDKKDIYEFVAEHDNYDR